MNKISSHSLAFILMMSVAMACGGKTDQIRGADDDPGEGESPKADKSASSADEPPPGTNTEQIDIPTTVKDDDDERPIVSNDPGDNSDKDGMFVEDDNDDEDDNLDDGELVRLIPEGDCQDFCEAFVENKCPGDDDFDVETCQRDCFGSDTLPDACGGHLLALYQCIEEELPITCRSGDRTAIVCGPCDSQLSVLSKECGLELECVFGD